MTPQPHEDEPRARTRRFLHGFLEEDAGAARAVLDGALAPGCDWEMSCPFGWTDRQASGRAFSARCARPFRGHGGATRS